MLLLRRALRPAPSCTSSLLDSAPISLATMPPATSLAMSPTLASAFDLVSAMRASASASLAAICASTLARSLSTSAVSLSRMVLTMAPALARASPSACS